MVMSSLLDRTYHRLHRLFLGEAPQHPAPPPWLWALWIAVALARLPSVTYSLDEDALWCLVTKIDQPWIVTLGFKDAYTLNHIVNSVLARVLIKSTRHHFVEFTYRIPSLTAGLMAMPLGYAVMMRTGGPLAAAFFGAAVAILPANTLHATSARGYMLLVFFTIWALGLTPGISGRIFPVRLGLAYFLLASSHGLGIINVCCFALFGCFAGGRRSKLSVFLVNGLFALPGLCYNIPMLADMRMERIKMAAPSNWTLADMTAFVPKWFEYQFGSNLVPGISFVYAALMIVGIAVVFKRSVYSGISLLLFTCCIPIVYIAAKTNWSQDWYSMGCSAFWLWGISAGAAVFFSWLTSRAGGRRRYIVILFTMLGLLMVPKLYEYLRYPRQDYSGVYRTIKNRFPDEKTALCFASEGITGLSYYARQNGMRFQCFGGGDTLGDSLWRQVEQRPAVIVVERNLSPGNRTRLRELSSSVRRFHGTGWTVSLYFLKNK